MPILTDNQVVQSYDANRRSLTLKRTLAICLLVACLPALSYAQTSDEGTGVAVTSNPPGAEVTLDGEATVTGVSPVHFMQPLIGDYTLKVRRRGWETYTTHLTLDPTKQLNVNVNLSPRTRFKAAARSFFIPGWGQKYSGQTGKAIVMVTLAVGTGTAYFIADHRFDSRYDTYNARLHEYDSLAANGTQPELEAAWDRLVSAQDKAYDAENTRRATIGAMIGAWAINMLDVLFFFPEERGTFSIKGLAIEPNASMDQVGVTLSTNF